MASKKRRLQQADDMPDLEQLLKDLDTGSRDFEVDFDYFADTGPLELDRNRFAVF